MIHRMMTDESKSASTSITRPQPTNLPASSSSEGTSSKAWAMEDDLVYANRGLDQQVKAAAARNLTPAEIESLRQESKRFYEQAKGKFLHLKPRAK